MAMAVALGDCSRDDADLLRRAMGSKRGRRAHRVGQAEALRRHGAPRHHRRPRRLDLRQDPVLRQLRLRRVARPVLRAARLRLLVVQAALPGGVPGRAAAQPADGLLLPAVAGRRRPPPRRRRTPPRRHPVGGAGRPRAARDRARSRPRASTRAAGPASSAPSGCRAPPTRCPPTAATGRSPYASGWTRCAASAWRWRARIVAARDEAPFTGITDLSRRADLTVRPAGGAGHRRRVRRAGGSTAARRCGRPASPRGPSTCPAPRPPRPRRRCPGMSEPEITLADLWATGVSPERPPGRAPARRAAPRRRPVGRRARRRRVRPPGPRRRARHPPPAARAPRWASPSSTSRTRPACSTSCARSG